MDSAANCCISRSTLIHMTKAYKGSLERRPCIQEVAVAVAAFRTLAGFAPDQAGAHYDLARALLASGKKTEAKKEVLKLWNLPLRREAQELLLKLSGE